jgi:hypothetical protein
LQQKAGAVRSQTLQMVPARQTERQRCAWAVLAVASLVHTAVGAGSSSRAALRGAPAAATPGALRTFGTAKSAFNLTNGVETTLFDYNVSRAAKTATMTHL